MQNNIFGPAEILLPDEEIDFSLWPAIACDQFTSEAEYWQKAEALVGENPSALHIILPEVYLEQPGVQERIDKIHQTMVRYTQQVLTRKHYGYVYVEREMLDGSVRQGLVGCVDLEAYSYLPEEAPLVRPTENTVLDRIPPRLAVRRGAPLETPHILMLADDPEKTLVEPVGAVFSGKKPDYQTELMLGGGQIRGWLVKEPEWLEKTQQAVADFTQYALEKSRYGGQNEKPFVFATGDGNHSLATAKALWEETKKSLSPRQQENHPARFCLLELENVHSEANVIEPIHRVVFHTDLNALETALNQFAQSQHVDLFAASGEPFKLVNPERDLSCRLESERYPLGVAFVDAFLLAYQKDHPEIRIDYVHGEESVRELSRENAVGILLAPMQKEDLFKGVALGGVLPKKTFSMGHATEKRYYLECRGIL